MPNVLSPIMVSATLGIANGIITESALSFLGLGFPPDFLLGVGCLMMRSIICNNILRGFLASLAISLTVLSINYLGDGSGCLDPRMHKR